MRTPDPLNPPQRSVTVIGPYQAVGGRLVPITARLSKQERLAALRARAIATLPHARPSRWDAKEKK